MHKRMLSILLLALITLFTGSAAAQGAPEQINLALADLNARLGVTLRLGDLANWSWSQDQYPDTSLGCPQPGIAYTQQIVVGYRFELTYNGIVYDYRVAADGSIVLLCSARSLAEVTPEPLLLDPADSNPLCPLPPAGLIYPPTRLAVDIQGVVSPGLPNTVRAEPNPVGTFLGEIPAGGVFNIVAGPQCDATGLVWWQVDFDGLIGWTAEGANGQYWLEPATAAPLPPAPAVITLENAGLLTENSRLYGNFAPGLRWSYTSELDLPPRLAAVGATGSGGLWLYDAAGLNLAPRYVELGTLLTNADFGPNPLLALVGAGDGSIRLWDLNADAPVLERARLQSQDNAVSAIAFSPDGTTLAATGGRAILLQDQPDNVYAIALWDVATVALKPVALRGHVDQVVALAYSADNTRLYSASRDGTVRLWNTTTGEGVVYYTAGQPITAMAFTRDGAAFALATDTRVIVLDALSGQALAELPAAAAITSVAFSPDAALLAAGDSAGAVVLWDVAAAASGSAQPAVMQLLGHEGAVESVTFSPVGTAVVTLGADNTIRWWVVVPNAG